MLLSNKIYFLCVWSWNGLGNSGRSGYSGKPVARNLNYFEFDLFSFNFAVTYGKSCCWIEGMLASHTAFYIFRLPAQNQIEILVRKYLIESKVKFGSASF